jgi:hypothetical protein
MGGLNTYGYARQNPFKWTDRSGLFLDPISITIGVGFGGVAGYQAGGPKGAVMGGIAGGIAGVVSPTLSAEAGGGVAGFLTFEGVNAVAATGATFTTNYVNGAPLANDLGTAILIATAGPTLSGEGFLVGGGLVEGSLGAERALGFNTGIIGLGGTLIDTKRGACPQNSASQVSHPSSL